MGLLDDAIREHLELKRRHGASPDDVARQEQEALGAVRREEVPAAVEDAPAGPFDVAEVEEAAEPEPPSVAEETRVLEDRDEVSPPEPEAPKPGDGAGAPGYDEDPWLEERDEVPADEALDHQAPATDPGEDVLEETPDFLQETPEHERLWFEQRPPRDFDWDQ
ncbi:MAG: hypothetical protein ACRDPC_03650 [Solirubrobacteraceae bacterium]